MFSLHPQEQRFIAVIFFLIIFGYGIQTWIQKDISYLEKVQFIESSKSYPKLDLNQATQEELESLPYIGKYTAKNIIDYRRRHQGFESVEEVLKVKGIRQENYDKFKNYLEVKGLSF